MKNAPPPGSHVLQPTRTILTFHEDRTLNVASRVHVLQPTRKFFKHVQDIIGKNLLTKFHEDWTINVASRENAPPPGGHVFQPTETILDLVQDINGKNYLTKFHKDWTINIATSVNKANISLEQNVLTKFYEEVLTRRNSPTPDILKTIVLTKFYEDWTINVTIRVSVKMPQPPGGYVMQPTGTIFKLVQDIVGTNLLTKFHYDQAINVASRVFTRENAPPPGGHHFQQTGTIFKLVQNIIGTNLLTKFHENWKINVITSVNKIFQSIGTIFELFHVASREKSPPPGGHLVQHIIGTNLLTNVASGVLTMQMVTSHDARQTKGDDKSSP
ncbi:hypothetical protein DPMN_189893 [Dreissena polymorpha]|uniref:Uncharacterized protein n=1 Tax=Dreissena polymorpha TaxID=45954 RepID=A0A9D4DTY4_DREPO|nr:hypothetical protein DPMN_189893 [Dreissena polymorpha]